MITSIKPDSHLGKWSFGCMIAFTGMLVLGIIISKTLGSQDDQINMLLLLPMVGAVVTVLCAFLTGMIAIIKKKERSILVIMSTLLGLYMLFMLVGEFIMPH